MTVVRGNIRPADRLPYVVDRLVELVGGPLRDYLREHMAVWGGRALEIYRLSTHPALLQHQATEVVITPEEFEQTYGAVFPRATITPMHLVRALCWHNTP
jgi:hypothetical protein